MPEISVIIPHKISRRHIMTVDSLLKQTYQDFEVIIIPDYEKIGAARCRNIGAQRAQAPKIFFADDDLILDPTCLKKMSDVLDINPTIGLVYCDYKLAGTKEGIQYGELWDPELLLKRNYISSMSMIRTEALFALNGFNGKLERYQDWDLWIRFSKMQLKDGFKPKGYYIHECLFTAYFDGNGISERGPEDRFKQTAKLKKRFDSKEYDHSVIIPVHNQLNYTKKCLETVLANTEGAYEIIVVDDASTDGTPAWLLEQEGVNVITMKDRVGHTKAINAGVAAANGNYLFLLNNDTLVPKAWNIRLSEILLNNLNVCAVGPLTSSAASAQHINDMYEHKDECNPDNINQVDKMITTKRERAAIPAKITGFCMATTRMIWDAVGKFDECIEAGGNEADWLLRAISMGFTPAIYTGLYVHHYGNISYSKIDNMKELWNKGNEYIMIKHGSGTLEHLEKDLWTDLLDGKK